MNAKQARNALNTLTDKLTEREFLAASGLTVKSVRMLMNRDYWEDRLGKMFPVKRRYTCSEIYHLCEEPLALLGREPEGGWMKFTYAFACHILYPDREFTEKNGQYATGALFYLAVMQYFFDEERKVMPFDHFYDFGFLGDEAANFESRDEYARFRKYFHQEYIYEMMRLGMEVTPFKTLEHIAGVHYVAMHVARGLYDAGVPIDLTLVSGAAAGHDLGKFGCKPNEKVPYLHYYYTDQWFGSHNMNYIGHIAANHSTWDLEPENLSVESLVLIYSDFRVKQSRGADNREITFISSLKEAFGVILSKLDNVDEVKLRRYKFVYSRLNDFENYMRYLGVDTDLNGKTPRPPQMPEIALRSTKDTVQSLIFMSVEHNVMVMHRMAAERQFGSFLEAARSEKNWKNLRAYLNIFDEYTAYTNDNQKKQILIFLYELLMHREGDIRAEAARLMGKIIAQYNFGYRKQRPQDMPDVSSTEANSLWELYLDRILTPDLKLTARQKRYIRFNLKNVMASLLHYAGDADLTEFLTIFMTCFDEPEKREDGEAFVILDSAHEMPLEKMTGDMLDKVLRFAVAKAGDPNQEVMIAAWRAAKILTQFKADLPSAGEMLKTVRATDTSRNVSLAFLKFRIFTNLGEDTAELERQLYEEDVVSDIFLDNLKTATPWIIKTVNIKLLKDQILHGRYSHKLHIAAHFSNLIKVSEHVVVRQDAGDALLSIMGELRPDERNEVVVELVRGLEFGEYEFSKYIPQYLGETALWLPEEQLDEIIAYLIDLLANANGRTVSGALDTIGVLLGCYPEYRERFSVSDENYDSRRKVLLGALLGGLANYRESVRQEAMQVVGAVFATDRMSNEEKYELFKLGFGKILFLMNEGETSDITVFYRASALSAISSFITAWHMSERNFDIEERKQVAFFPGTFDPFTLSHKEIVREIRDLGYEVFLAVDEFSWSKKTQPHLIRRRIVNMSVADEFHVNLFPDDIPVNIANPSDLKRLKEVFKGRDVFMVVGSDVIANASSYRKKPSANSIHSMNHIAFRRVGDKNSDSRYNRDMMNTITGKVVELELPERFEDISSSMIRENIDMNRDISNLIEPVVQEYIYNNGLYLREPEFKPLASGKVLSFEEPEAVDADLIREMGESVLKDVEEKEKILEDLRSSGDSVLLLRNMLRQNHLVGVVRFRYLASAALFSVLRDVELADQVRRRTSGEILLISGIYCGRDSMIGNPEQYLLSEVIARSFLHSCSYAIYYPKDGYVTNAALSVVLRQGFVRAEDFKAPVPLYLVDMQTPLVILKNMETTIKEPLASNPHILRVLEKAHRELQSAMTELYPGQLVLSLSAATIYPRLVEKVTELNGVPGTPVTPRRLGDAMCVPFGKILRDKVIPNTVTKTLHTDKVFDPELREGVIEAFPNYAPLPNQIRMIKSFNRPVILVDDLLHRGGRFEALLPDIKREHVEIKKVILGVLSGYGRDTMAVKGVDVDSVYYIPNLRHWMVESTLYPFIGGDTVRRSTTKIAGLGPSINMILPYTKPVLRDTTQEALFDFSACCIRNARDIFMALEEEYRTRFGRNLTLERLSEAVIAPLCPDRGECVNYDPNLGASVYLENDLEMLYRTK